MAESVCHGGPTEPTGKCNLSVNLSVIASASMKQQLTRICTFAFFAFLWVCVSVFFCWSAGAIRYLTWLPPVVGIILSVGYFVGGLYLWRLLKPKKRWLTYAAAAVIVVYLLTLTQRASNERDWVAEQAVMPTIKITDGSVQINNFRHTTYRSESDFTPEFHDYSFELNQLTSVWFLVQRFTPLNGLAHTFISFGLETDDGPQFFSVSVEIRREKNEIYSPIRGLYRQYELMYVVGDERDLIGARTNMRQSDRVYMYRVNATPEEVQKLFVEISDRSSVLHDKPEFYNTMLNNCTNNIVSHTYKLTPEPINPMDPRIAIPGYSARFAYAMGLIGNNQQPFSELQDQCRIDEIAKRAGITESFSTDIRIRDGISTPAPSTCDPVTPFRQ